jgi:hypothetical protein
MITLLSDRPFEPYEAELAQFGRLAGLWETQIAYYPSDGSPARRAEGEWEFGYALEGRAVLDVWQVPRRSALGGGARPASQECGLCVRIWDPRLQLWRFTFHGTAQGVAVHMFAREIDDEIVLERADPGQLLRWIFSDIEPATFRWRSERSGDGGRTWRLEQEVDARRVRRAGVTDLAGSGLEQVLPAAAPHPSVGDQALVFDRFVGTWDGEYAHFAGDGSLVERYSGEVTFGWIVDGRAMQDVWIGEPADGRTERRIGTSIRFFDAASAEWHVFWFAPEAGIATTVKGGVVGDRIVLEGENADGSSRRWSFNDIRPESFVWLGERSADGGRTWHRTAEYRFRRRAID